MIRYSKSIFSVFPESGITIPVLACPGNTHHGYPINPMPFTAIKVTDNSRWSGEYADKYSTVKGNMDTVNYKPVTPDAVIIEAGLPAENSTGIYEWEVK